MMDFRRNLRTSNDDFSQKNCEKNFHLYTSSEEPEMLGPEGMQKLCADIGLEPENVLMLVLAYKMDAARMGYFSKREWLRGLSAMQCDSIAELKQNIHKLESLLYDPISFGNIYIYAFHFAKESARSGLETRMAQQLWQLLLGGRWPLLEEFVEFLDKSNHSIINKDLWTNVLEFAQTINEDLANYDTEEAWPVILDEFVVWLREKRNRNEIVSMDM